jgi:glycosyltransferase involved in cell wall biosynthesis
MDPTARIIIRRNDVELPMRADRPPERAASDRLRLIHIGRCVPKKGLDIALEALKSVEAPVDLDIFGHEEDRSYTDRCKRIAAELSNESRVRFAGHIHTDNVRDTIRVYDAVLVPTLGENFGHVIAEALSVSCPVMVSDNTPWSETVRRGGGSVVAPNTPQSWAKAIDDYFRAGLMGWADAHTQAGAAYEDWFATTLNQPHLFELAVRVMLELDRNSQGRPH